MDVLNLNKGEKIDLTKKNPGLKKLNIGLGWDVSTSGVHVDLDGFAMILNDGKLKEANKNFVYFSNLSASGVTHSGDNLTGEGEGDDEVISIDLSKVEGSEIVVGVNIFQAASRRQNFGQVKKATIRVVNPETSEVLAKYDLSEDHSSSTGMILGRIYKHEGEWKFQAVGEGKNGDLNEIAKTFQ